MDNSCSGTNDVDEKPTAVSWCMLWSLLRLLVMITLRAFFQFFERAAISVLKYHRDLPRLPERLREQIVLHLRCRGVRQSRRRRMRGGQWRRTIWASASQCIVSLDGDCEERNPD